MIPSPRPGRRDRAGGFVAAVAAGLVGLAVTASCGGPGEPPDLSGVEITVGSRDFVEQFVMSEILIQALERAGAEVTDATDTGDLEATREALTTGRIDAYWEYDSAVWIDVLGNEPDPDLDGGELLERLRDLDAERGIRWIGRSMFDDTYGFAMSPGTAAENAPTRYSVDAPDLARMVELVREDRDLELCVEPEFVERRDGLSLLEERTGAEVPDEQVRVLDDIDQIAPAVARGDCDFGEVFTTSGQIEALDLRLVQDRGVFAEYRLSLTIRDDALRQAPDALEQTVDRILSELPSSRIRELNGRVGQGEPVEAVATEFLDRFVE